MARQKDDIHYGIHAVRHALQYSPEDVLELWLADSRKPSPELKEILALANVQGIQAQRVHPGTIAELTRAENHQGVAIRRRPPRTGHEDDLKSLLSADSDHPKLFLILDGVQDPHNLGAVLRTSDAAGVQAVIAPKDNAVGLTATVCKVASGAAGKIPFITVTNLARTMRMMQEANVWLLGTDDGAEKEIYDINLSGNICIVLGAEGRGLRQNVRKHCDDLMRIPMRGTVESLNVSVAAGICLYEVLRQRRNA